MAVINTTVAKSHDVKDAALNLNVKAYELRRTLAAVWDLKPTAVQPPSPKETISLDMKNAGGESVVGGDERVRVPDHDIAPGGKYRSIVKLFCHYEFQKPGQWAHGTGWLIRPDIFVTAGHCSYDWGHKMGRADEVKAYIGYKGNDSTKEADVQFRRVKRIVTTEGWVKTKGQKSFDVSFMQVDKPFTGVTPIRFEETPVQGNVVIGVVGYPADLYDKRTGEHGAYMHEMFLPTEYNLAMQNDTMLEYQIDTYGGNSGSPVLRHDDLVSIGAHVYGGEVNSASVIGRYGNPYQDYLAAFELHIPSDGLNLVPVTGNTTISAPVPSGFGANLPTSAFVASSATGAQRTGQHQSQTAARLASPLAQHPTVNQNVPASTRGRLQPGFQQSGPQQTGFQQSGFKQIGSRATPSVRYHHDVNFQGKPTVVKNHLSDAGEEGFLEVLKTVARVGAPLLGKSLNAALPVALGPIGGPVGALAGFALNAAGKLAAESHTAESALDTPNLHEGSMERAILAEAALTALQSNEFSEHLEESIFTDMKDSVMQHLPAIRKAAPHVMGAMMEPALRIALDSLHKYNTTAASGAESFEGPAVEPFRPTTLYSPAIDSPVDARAEAFLANVQAAMDRNLQESAVDGGYEEAWADVLKAGLRLGSGILTAAKHGLPILAQALASQGGSAESAVVGPTTSDTSHAFSADALAQRAVVAEAALQAVMKLPPQQLQEEGFFGFLSDAVKTIAPVAIKLAPTIASAINPTVGKIVKGVLGQESYTGDGLTATQGADRGRLTPGANRLAKKSSLAAIRDHHNGNGVTGSNAERQRRYEQGVGLNNQVGVAY